MRAASVAAAKASRCNMANSTSVDYFALFGLQPAFVIDSKKLAATYRDLAREVHPDRFASAAAAQQREAVERAAQLNEAYETLRSPTQRALYLLRQQAELPEETTIQDAEFLFQQMEWRERLETLQAQEDIDALALFTKELKQIRKTIDEEFASSIEDPEQRVQAERLARRMHFIKHLIQELHTLSA